jgi:hypothetical protein
MGSLWLRVKVAGVAAGAAAARENRADGDPGMLKK